MFTDISLYSLVEREFVRLKCLALQYNTVTQAELTKADNLIWNPATARSIVYLVLSNTNFMKNNVYALEKLLQNDELIREHIKSKR